MPIKTMDTEQISRWTLSVLPYELILTKPDYRIQFVNRVFQEKSGFGLKELQGQDIHSIFSVENPVGLIEKLLKHIQKKTWQGELIFTGKSKEDFSLPVFAQAVQNEKGKILGYLFTATEKSNASNSKTANKPWLERTQNGADSQLFQTPEWHGLVQKLSHRLNNPLVGVFNFTQLLLENLSPKDPLYEIAQTIYEAATECKEIIEQWRNSNLDSSDGDHLHDDKKS
jgi:nitrogen-specific signal transduction histidine kinase